VSSKQETATQSTRVWDLPTRIFHWALAAAILVSWASTEFAEALADPTLKIHRYSGYAVLILIVWRVLWGLVGPRPVRFSSFLHTPGQIVAYARKLPSRHAGVYLSHNPLGGLAVLAILAIVFIQAALGLISEEHNATTWGPLYFMTKGETRAWVTELHEDFFEVAVLGIIALHVAAVAYHSLFKNEKLVRAMVSGAKPSAQFVDAKAQPDPRSIFAKGVLAESVVALGCLAVATGTVFGTIVGLGGRLFY